MNKQQEENELVFEQEFPIMLSVRIRGELGGTGLMVVFETPEGHKRHTVWLLRGVDRDQPYKRINDDIDTLVFERDCGNGRVVAIDTKEEGSLRYRYCVKSVILPPGLVI